MKFFAAIVLLAAAAAAQADSELADTIKAGDRRAALEMIAKGVDVNAAQGDGTTPIHWAAYRVDVDLVKQLLAKGAKADVKNNFGATPLAEGVKVGNVPLVKMLLDAGANANGANEDDQTPLMLAAKTGVVEIADLLVRHKARVNESEKWRGQTALMWAASEGYADMTDFLIKHGANVKVRAALNDWGSQITSEPRAQYRPTGGLTPLLYAVRAGCDRCVTAFMTAAGLGVSIRDPIGNYLAPDVQKRAIATMALLRKAGADVNKRITDTSGHTARIARPSTMTTRQGQTAIYGAINWGWTEVVQDLLAHGARVDIVDAAGKTPIDASLGNAGGRDYKKVDEIVALIKNATTAQTEKPLSASASGGSAN